MTGTRWRFPTRPTRCSSIPRLRPTGRASSATSLTRRSSCTIPTAISSRAGIAGPDGRNETLTHTPLDCRRLPRARDRRGRHSRRVRPDPELRAGRRAGGRPDADSGRARADAALQRLVHRRRPARRSRGIVGLRRRDGDAFRPSHGRVARPIPRIHRGGGVHRHLPRSRRRGRRRIGKHDRHGPGRGTPGRPAQPRNDGAGRRRHDRQRRHRLRAGRQ